MHKAFKAAYRAVRWHYGYWGWYSITGTEAETLGGLCSDILNREVINDIIYNIPAGPQRNFTVSMLRKTVDASVVAAVGAAWNASVQACEALRGTLESTVKGLLNPIFEQEVKIKTQITDKVGAKINPFLEENGKTVCRPVLKAATSGVTKCFCAAIGGLNTFMLKQINDGSFNKENFDYNIKWAHRSVEYWYSGPLEESNRIAWNIYTSDLGAVAALFTGGFTSYSLYSDVLDAVRDLTHRAIHQFEEVAREQDLNDLSTVLSQVLSKMVHDAKLSETSILESILNGVLRSPLESTVINPCLELVQPIQDVIDAIPVPGLSDLFNLSSLVEEVLGSIVDNAISAIVAGSVGDINQQIDAAGAAVGVRSA
jgi:hypothetical protein